MTRKTKVPIRVAILLLFVVLQTSKDSMGQILATHYGPLVSAHRGANRVAPENTMAAFSQAIAGGADFIEIDVRTTLDDGQVIMHDASLKRTTGLDARVDKTTLSEISQLSAGKWFGPSFEDEHVPTLEDVCLQVSAENRGREYPVKLYVDCKAINTGEVIRILNKYQLLDSAVFYGDVNTLKEIKKFYDKARVMPSYPGEGKMERMNHKIHPYAVDVPYASLDAHTVSFCHGKGIRIFSDLLGEFDNPAAYRNALKLGIDLIQTDDIVEVRRIINEFESQPR